VHKILVVDDEPEIVKIMSMFLRKCGYDIVTAQGGQKALEILRRDNEIKMILIEMRMQDMEGTDVIREMRKIGIKTPFLMLTGLIDSERYTDELRGLGCQAGDVLQKPIDLNTLLMNVKKKLGETA